MADPAELIPTQKAVWLLRHLDCRVDNGSIMLAKSALAALSPAPTVPEGWKMVPETPTLEMFTAAHGAPTHSSVGQIYTAMLAASPQPPVAEGWRDIASAPDTQTILLGGYVVPSAEAQANGSKTAWHYGIGSYLWDGQWTGFLGSRPTHWQPLPAPPAPEAPR